MSRMLLDTASLYYRAYFGVPSSLTTPDGQSVNAVRGLLDFISRFVTEYRPDELVCCWDDDWRPAWRVELIESYKAHRALSEGAEETPDDLAVQIPWIRQVLQASGIAVVGADGYEADDVIATLSDTAVHGVDIATGDRDLFQLVDDARAVRVLYCGRGVARHERVDEAWVKERYQVPASRYVDFAVLRGDPSDGLPGVAGVGDKTAAALVRDFPDLESMLAAAEKGLPSAAISRRLLAAVDYLGPARTVVAVASDIALPDLDLSLPAAPKDSDRFAELSAELGLGTSASRLVAALETTAQSRRST